MYNMHYSLFTILHYSLHSYGIQYTRVYFVGSVVRWRMHFLLDLCRQKISSLSYNLHVSSPYSKVCWRIILGRHLYFLV